MGSKQNCWEFKKCGKEPGGAKVSEFGVCPSATDTSANRLNGGENAGRICWAIAGTFCDGKVQGVFAEKKNTCIGCDFFCKVNEEEGKKFKILI